MQLMVYWNVKPYNVLLFRIPTPYLKIISVRIFDAYGAMLNWKRAIGEISATTRPAILLTETEMEFTLALDTW